MNAEPNTNVENQFIAYLGSLVHDNTTPFFSRKSEYPVDVGLLTANAFYAKVLFDIAFGYQPTLEQFSGMNFLEDDEVVYQNAIYLYKKWNQGTLADAVVCYCQYLNRIVDRSAISKSEKDNVIVPDFRRCERDVLGEIERLRKETII